MVIHGIFQTEVTALLEDMFIFFLALIQRKNVVERDEWTPELKERQWLRWRIRTALAMEKCTLKDQRGGNSAAGVVDFPRFCPSISCYATPAPISCTCVTCVCFLKARTGFFWLGTTIYIAGSHLYTSLFIANVRPVDALDWINAMIAGLVQAAVGG
jgi:hypothetical protein